MSLAIAFAEGPLLIRNVNGDGAGGLPAVRGGDPPSPISRLRTVRALASTLPAIGVEMQSLPDGRTAIILPAEIAEVFVQDLEQRAREWQEAIRRVRLKEQAEAAERAAGLAVIQRHNEAEEERLALAYAQCRERGQGHREALRTVAGVKAGDRIPGGSLVAEQIQRGLARLRRSGLLPRPVRLRGKAKAEREAAILALAQQGINRREIADRVKLEYANVCAVLKRAGMIVPDERKRPQPWT